MKGAFLSHVGLVYLGIVRERVERCRTVLILPLLESA
jgi:hypothetical protein